MNYVQSRNKIIFNVSSGLVNYTQRNNDYIKLRKVNIVNSTNVCNTTSMCMGSSYAGWRFPDKPYPQYKQEEDRLTAFCIEDKRVSAYYKKLYPTLWKEWQDDKKDALPPNQVHMVLAYATNLWFGQTVVTFREDLSMKDMAYEIVMNGLPVVVSGVFPKNSISNEKINHIVVLVGAIYDEDDVKKVDYKLYDISRLEPTNLIFDDPWGNFIEGYDKMKTGNDVICPYKQALDYLKPTNDYNFKWGHIFTKAPSII
jgi:hypothetical protein